MTTPHVRIGTSGYSYKAWKGSFYPDDLPAAGMLAYYAERLDTVELNNTFYRMPRANVVEAWAAQVPDHFRFAIKASRRITHLKRLKDVGEEVGYLFDTLGVLGPRLGPVLFQLPPNFKQDLDRLRGLLELIPRGVRVALEFRHDSWSDQATRDLLREHDAALCHVDDDEIDDAVVHATADWGYVRLRGSSYDDAALDAWAARLRDHAWTDAFVFFKHEDAGAGPAFAARLRERLAGD